ncbi:2-C-methyl-D-erythritol 4-phosphate cytidylyltransferase [Vibrio scophthalmi]|uniref:2-C-methyl-D-erythritol 4-phosphate cytidylyltransferase n=1 Tax=Vibrio scophthalmi TaxID=45658 RepID=A0A1B1NRY8_9VIBR|nr:2-C-methyl-D-erythritol 4-phosphate cytidylyltransferase [Vibrio scophthalmi]ANS86522.1 2-C-methyl-D-erythritol 4-phosphate cytidylyltransferase [Vibrio scophthalmi]ANU35345.1 2-C-methyl-D-erythritol 4-phosphate cytidylyltransferase [Vibrio scophthalmi]ODS12451.1 2-C-methyl-D-erythritol 4-phosphate cytidylyltransferase [Vibrio scophthalmi]
MVTQSSHSTLLRSIVAIVPAAGVGSRMKAGKPKQYLTIGQQTVLEHTVEKLLAHPAVGIVVVAITDGDPYFPELSIATHPRVMRVSGGKERADSVLSALQYVQAHQLGEWAMVHDAARPCVRVEDLNTLISVSQSHNVGAILASPVRDTMKRSNQNGDIDHTVDREALWHALTPQMFKTEPLTRILSDALAAGAMITDEASAFEWAGLQPALVQGYADNIKITQPEDLALAEFYLEREKG